MTSFQQWVRHTSEICPGLSGVFVPGLQNQHFSRYCAACTVHLNEWTCWMEPHMHAPAFCTLPFINEQIFFSRKFGQIQSVGLLNGLLLLLKCYRDRKRSTFSNYIAKFDRFWGNELTNSQYDNSATEHHISICPRKHTVLGAEQTQSVIKNHRPKAGYKVE